MRPRHLELVAFGPFAEAVVVDFDRLVDTGLFVVSGPTGAGKTSLFDGICFALYGRLAGHRDRHSDVRSDHAAPDRPTEVAFTFDAGGECWRVWRHPRQERPKRKGTGVTVDGPRASLERWDGQRWQAVESRWEPVNQRCRQLVGLDADQFQQVVLLPQGRFQEVLNARSADRQGLLRTLFRSQLYQRGQDVLDRWAKELEEQIGSTERQRREHREWAHRSLTQAVAALRDHDVPAAVSVPPAEAGVTDSIDALGVVGPDPLAVALDGLEAGPVADLERRRRVADVAAAQAARVASLAHQTATLVEKRAALRRDQAELDGQAPTWAAKADALAQARRAAPVRHAAQSIAARRSELDQARDRLDRAWAHARRSSQSAGIDLAEAPDHDALEQARLQAEMRAKLMAELAELRDEALALEAAAADARRDHQLARDEHQRLLARQREAADQLAHLARERERLAGQTAEAVHRRRDWESARRRARLRRRLVELDTALDRAGTERIGSDDRVAALDEKLARLAADRDAAAEVARGAADAAGAVERRRVELERWRATATARIELERADAALAGARARADATLARFIQGTAPRLAAQLEPGQPCPVCGSAEHPAPAPALAGADPVEVADLERSSTAAAEAEERRSRAATTLAALLAELGPRAEESEASLQQAWDEARRDVARCLEAQDRAAELDAQLVTRRQERTTAIEQRQRLDHAIAASTTERAELVGALGPEAGADPADLDAAVVRARALVDEADEAGARLDQLAAERDDLVARAEQDQVRIAELVSRVGALEQREASARQRAGALRAEVATAAGRTDPGELAGIAGRAVAALDRARPAVTARDVAAGALQAAVERGRDAVTSAGFASLEDALAASLPPDGLDQLDEAVRAWQRRRDDVRAAAQALDAQPLPAVAPDVDHLDAVAETAHRCSVELAELAGQVGAQLEQARHHLGEVARVEARDRDLRARARLARTGAEVVRGRNSRNVALEAWVLAAHLREVVEHANQHLSAMSGGRYRLLVSDAVPDGRTRAGLDLAVDDAFTGSTRPTVSLSGGETFQASLALALGMADVVTAGRAGLRLDALFIDEGFGSLDAESLDQAIDVLDGLRSRGALVGVVTHVESMKNALPVAIEVRPRADRRGSTVHQAA